MLPAHNLSISIARLRNQFYPITTRLKSAHLGTFPHNWVNDIKFGYSIIIPIPNLLTKLLHNIIIINLLVTHV